MAREKEPDRRSDEAEIPCRRNSEKLVEKHNSKAKTSIAKQYNNLTCAVYFN